MLVSPCVASSHVTLQAGNRHLNVSRSDRDPLKYGPGHVPLSYLREKRYCTRPCEKCQLSALSACDPYVPRAEHRNLNSCTILDLESCQG